MKLELTIADDKELRAFIKDQIKGMVLSVARDEVVEVVSKATNEKGITDKDFIAKLIQGLIYSQLLESVILWEWLKELFKKKLEP